MYSSLAPFAFLNSSASLCKAPFSTEHKTLGSTGLQQICQSGFLERAHLDEDGIAASHHRCIRTRVKLSY